MKGSLIGFDVSAAKIITSHSQLIALDPSIKNSIHGEFDAEMLSTRVCPVRMSDQSVALFGLREYVASDQANELARRVVAKGYVLSDPQRFILEAPLLLALARSQLPGIHIDAAGMGMGLSRSALTGAFQDLIEWGVRNGASDLHININTSSVESEVRYTISGSYVAPQRFKNMSTGMLVDMLSVIWMDVKGGNGALFDPRVEQQGSLIRQVDGYDVVIRWASLSADSGPSVCMRILVQGITPANMDLSSLGYTDSQVLTINRAMKSSGGAVIFAGTVGSGKSTTLAALISNLSPCRKVITLEDPVEYKIPNAIQNTVSRSLNDSQPFVYASKLMTVKRSAMTDVLLGEIRDTETGKAFMDLASSGINVYSTVHAPSATLVPDRLCSDFIGVSRDFLLTPKILKLIVYQTLIARLCTHCSLPVGTLLKGFYDTDGHMRSGTYWGQWLDSIQSMYCIDVSGMRIRNINGCASCSNGGISALKGYEGRTVVAEIIEPPVQQDFLDSVRNGNLICWLSQNGFKAGDKSVLNAKWRSAMDNAVIKSCNGIVDPRDIEQHFESFETNRLRIRRVS